MAKTGCQCDPSIKKMWGCEEPAQQAVWMDIEENEYYSCPIKCIPDNIIDWFDEYAFYKEFGGSLVYSKLPSKWLESRGLYNNYLNIYTEEQISMKTKKGDGLSTLRSGVKTRARKR